MALVGSELTAIGSIPTAAGSDSPGEGGGVPTLAAVYAAGAGAPITDDLMAMLHGNMRFQSPVDSAPLPLLGYWEDATGQGTAASGFPSELWSLAVIVGTDTGRRFGLYQMFDPAWDGTFRAINGMSWELERVAFTNDPTNEYRNQNLNPVFGSRSWKILNNWASVSYPQGTSVNGTVSQEHSAYNTIDLGLRFIDRMDGWGQTDRELTPQSNGITWQWSSHWNAVNITGAANDGIGWGIYSGDITHTNHVQAGLVARQVTGDPQGDWYWSFLVSDGAGALSDIADFARTGITFNVPVTFNGTPTVAEPAVWYRSGLLDFTTVADNIPVGIPQRPGFIFCANRSAIYLRDGTGTGTAGNLSVTVGNNATHDNLSGPSASSFIPFASINGALTHVPTYLGGGVGGSTTTPPLLDSATQIVGKINTVVTGITSLHGYILVFGFWVPA